MAKQKKVLLGVTGSIAAYKSAEIIRRLMAKGLSVTVVMTREAERFITPLTLQALSGQKVYRRMFEKDGNVEKIPHIDLAKDADVFLIAPATANIIGKLAQGLADDLLTCIALTTRAPVLVAPAMNTLMYENRTVRENCLKLKKRGAMFIEPVKGKLACGTTGKGHLADEDSIIKAVLKCLK